MKRTVQILVTTLIGGVVFLIPAVVVVFVVGKALKFTSRLAAPLAAWIPMDTVGGIALANLLAIALMLVICFIAGLVAKKSFARNITERLDSKLQEFFPRYSVIKGMTQQLNSDSDKDRLKPVLARFDDTAQIAFEIERSKNGLVSLFLPGSPDPWAGTVVHMPVERVEPLDADFGAVIKSLKGIGAGTSAILDGQKTK